MTFQHIKVPADGAKITVNQNLSLSVPNNPIIPYIEGDGIGVDITPVMQKVVDAAVEKAYGGQKKGSLLEGGAGVARKTPPPRRGWCAVRRVVAPPCLRGPPSEREIGSCGHHQPQPPPVRNFGA